MRSSHRIAHPPLRFNLAVRRCEIYREIVSVVIGMAGQCQGGYGGSSLSRGGKMSAMFLAPLTSVFILGRRDSP